MRTVEMQTVAGRKRSNFFNITGGEIFYAGGGSGKIRCESTSVNDRLHKYSQSLIQRVDLGYSETWKVFKKVGLPVVPTLRSAKDGMVVFVTDLTADGSAIYGKGTWNILGNWTPLITDGQKRVNTERDSIFLELTNSKNFESIQKECMYFSFLATENKLFLPWNDPFDLVVHPDNTKNIMCLDLHTGGEMPSEVRFDSLSLQDKELLAKGYKKANEELVEIFLDYLLEIRRKLIT